jgi:DinB superfamily/Pentapeptide repeats (8 copies)
MDRSLASLTPYDAAMTRYAGTNEFRAAEFVDADLSGALFREVDLSGARLRGVLLRDADIDGDITGLRVNGVDVAPLVEAELDRRYPERTKLRPTTPAGLREALTTVELIWADTLREARERPAEEVHRSVDGEWSLVQTLRHLVFATDAWFRNAVKGEPDAFDPLGLPFSGLTVHGFDLDARPDLDTVLAIRAGRLAELHDYAEAVSPEELARERPADPDQPWPPPGLRAPLTCLRVIFKEEWAHHQFVRRDLAVIDEGKVPGT